MLLSLLAVLLVSANPSPKLELVEDGVKFGTITPPADYYTLNIILPKLNGYTLVFTDSTGADTLSADQLRAVFKWLNGGHVDNRAAWCFRHSIPKKYGCPGHGIKGLIMFCPECYGGE